jgi:hypothetical protein
MSAGLPAPPVRAWRWVLLVVVGFAAFHGPSLARRYEPNSWLFADGAFYFTTLRALTEHGRLEQKDLQPASWYERDLGWNRRLGDDWSNVALGREGRWYPKHPILLPLLSVPLYALLGTPGTLATNVLLNLAFVLLVFLLARRVAPPPLAAAAAVLTAAMPFVQAMSYSFSNDLLGAVLVLGAFEAALGGRLGLAGVLGGLALWSRLTNVAFVPGLLLVALDAGGWRAAQRAVGFALAPLAIFGGLNTWQFGVPWTTSYQNVLVRENGVAQVASHARLFTIPFVQGLRRIVLGDDGAFASFPPLAFGLAGVLPLALRRGWQLALAFALFALLPALVFAKYAWYRAHFLYPVYGLSAVGLAALGAWAARRPPVGELREEWARPRWTLPFFLLILLAGGGALRIAARPDPTLLSARVAHARVLLDELACDYWNPQNERWECASWDKGGWMMTGAIVGRAPTVRGEPRRGIWLHAHPSGKWRRIVFDALPAERWTVDLALSDETRPGPVEIELRPRGSAPLALTMDGGGSETQRTIAIAPGEGPALEIRARATGDASWKQLVVEGRPEP